ncbi:MAG: response regulator [Planctomycetota bacterium]|nr:response regulator [Planctomycetota bacterium]
MLQAIGKSAEPARNTVPANPPAVARPSLHVLLAEDNPVNQEVAVAMLQELGCTVSLAGNGREACAAVQRESFDLVFMDVQMPEMGGIEATTEIRRREESAGGRTPIVAMTAHAMKADLDRCLQAGMDHWVTKPISGSKLAEVLDRIIAARATPGAGAASFAAAPGDVPVRRRPDSPAVLDVADLRNWRGPSNAGRPNWPPAMPTRSRAPPGTFPR